METPYITHITSEDYKYVYEPAEDSFLLMDALEDELKHIVEIKPLVCVEIGSGSGVNITALAKELKSDCACFAIDINPYACKVTQKTAKFNIACLDVLNMDLLTAFRDDSIDILFFNPPYVPTSSEELNLHINHIPHSTKSFDKNLIKAWAGGDKGCEVIDRLFLNLSSKLTTNGIFYLLVLKENNPKKISEKLKFIGFHCMKIKERKIRGEHLFVLKIYRIK